MSVYFEYLQHVYKILSERERIRLDCSRPQKTPGYPTPEQVFYSVANSLNFRTSNRYYNILAYDRTAVAVNAEGYLNANVICDTKGGWWVASQAPVPDSFHAFFRAIYTRAASTSPALLYKSSNAPERKAAILVQLTGWDESGVSKADRYMPTLYPGQGNSYLTPRSPIAMQVRTLAQERLVDLSTNLTKLHLYAHESPDPQSSVAHGGEAEIEAMMLWHYHFDAWPDHGVPRGKGVNALVALVKEIGRRRNELGGVDGCEVWVHCSAGVGRTGTFIALSSLLLPPMVQSSDTLAGLPVSPLGPLPSSVEDDEIARTVDQFREWRGMLVQGPDQLRLIYEVVGVQTRHAL